MRLTCILVWLSVVGAGTSVHMPRHTTNGAPSVSSLDGNTVVTIDPVVGSVSAISFQGVGLPVSGGASALGECVITGCPLVMFDQTVRMLHHVKSIFLLNNSYFRDTA